MYEYMNMASSADHRSKVYLAYPNQQAMDLTTQDLGWHLRLTEPTRLEGAFGRHHRFRS